MRARVFAVGTPAPPQASAAHVVVAPEVPSHSELVYMAGALGQFWPGKRVVIAPKVFADLTCELPGGARSLARHRGELWCALKNQIRATIELTHVGRAIQSGGYQGIEYPTALHDDKVLAHARDMVNEYFSRALQGYR